MLIYVPRNYSRLDQKKRPIFIGRSTYFEEICSQFIASSIVNTVQWLKSVQHLNPRVVCSAAGCDILIDASLVVRRYAIAIGWFRIK